MEGSGLARGKRLVLLHPVHTHSGRLVPIWHEGVTRLQIFITQLHWLNIRWFK
jgi:hypothetical protein